MCEDYLEDNRKKAMKHFSNLQLSSSVQLMQQLVVSPDNNNMH